YSLSRSTATTHISPLSLHDALPISMIHTAGHIDLLMPHRMTIKINSALNRSRKSINGSSILFMGVAYKPNISDERESPALKIIRSEEHTSELQSRENLVCRLLLEKK